ncbi:MAG TPA: aminotransferase class V-fold PLP-dependent enzyme [Tepidisphaeraceae bacterium]|nr:aminotransferase class V-fold PLP-dependent enzyme [Tepidisphaeraceae bacterium]
MQHLIGNPDEFPILKRWDFFNHAGVCPLPRRAGDALRQFATQFEDAAYLGSGFYRQIDALRASAAKMINATPGEIALIKNTSEGVATVANAIDWRPGDRVVTTAVEYPANMYPWMDVSRRFGVELVAVAEETQPDGSRAVPVDALLAACEHPRTRLLALSHVEYASGQRFDLRAIGQYTRPRNILLAVDAIQSLGVLPVDVRAMNIDFLAADGHKWLLGPEGAGVFYCRSELLATARPLIVGWMNVINDQDYGNYDFTLKPDARRFEGGTLCVPAFLSLKASLEMLLEVGTDAVAARLKVLTDRLIVGLRGKGYQIISPRAGDEWSGIVSFASPLNGQSSQHEHAGIFRRLRDSYKTEIAVREGRLRVSAHFYNTEEQIDRLVDRLPAHS